MSKNSSSVDLTAKLQALPIFQNNKIDAHLLSQLQTGISFRRFTAGDILFRAQETADGCYVVSMGSVKLTRMGAGGREVVMCFCRQGDFIAAAIMMNPSPKYPLTATSLEDSGLIYIPRQIYIDVWQANPQIARAINLNIMERMLEFQDDKTLSTSSVPEKIANFLLRSLDSQPEIYGNTLNLKLSRRDIAERVGTSVETVIRILSQWSQNGWITTDEQRIAIINRAALEDLRKQD